jgi:hypothetical protein
MSDDQAAVGALDFAEVCGLFERLVFQRDDEPLETLLTRYASLLRRFLAQPVGDSEAAWAHQSLANFLAVAERAAEAVSAHETFERWLPGKAPRLSPEFPHYPAPAGAPAVTLGPDEISVQFLGQSVEFATSYGAVGRYADFVSKCEAALARLAPNEGNLILRFYAVRIFMTAAHIADDFTRAEHCIRTMHAIADETLDAEKSAELHAITLGSEVQLAQAHNDEARAADTLQRGVSLLEEIDRNASSGRDWVRRFRHTLAHHLIPAGRHDLALPLLDAILATGRHFGGGWGWLMHAAAVWRVNRDRPRTLALLRDARSNDRRDLVGEFQGIAGFNDVRDDPEFLAAISGRAGSNV